MIKILVDPGHAWNGNPYPSQKGYYEGTQMWKLAQYLQLELEKRGFYVKNTRPNLKDFHDVAVRGRMAEGCDLVISLHSNAPGSASDTKTTGTVIIYTLETPKIVPLADDMGKKISTLMNHYYRGSIIMRSTSRIGENRNSVLRNAMRVGCKAGLLVEHGFHTNPKDAAFLARDENLKKIAIAEAEAIARFYGSGSAINIGRSKEGEIMLSRTLRHGMEGEDIGLVQQYLKNLGYYTGVIDNKFGPGQGFLNAVKAYQQAEGLEPDGVIGAKTRARLIEMMLQPKGVEKIVEVEKVVEKIVEVESPESKKKIEKLEADLKIANNNLIVVQGQVKNANADNVEYKEYFKLQNRLSAKQ